MTAAFRLSRTTNFGAPPRKANRSTCAPIQSASLLLGRLGEDEVRRAHDRDEHLHRPNLARHWVDDVDRVAGKIDEDLFAGGVALAHLGRSRLLNAA